MLTIFCKSPDHNFTPKAQHGRRFQALPCPLPRLMKGSCDKFEPNLWQPRKCKNCFELHSPITTPAPSPAVEPPPRKRIPSHPAHRTPKHHSTQPTRSQTNPQQESNGNHSNNSSNNEGVKRKKGGPSGSSACESFSPQRWRTNICTFLEGYVCQICIFFL